VNDPTYIFDNKFVFWALDRMMHYILVVMEDSSSIQNWKEKCELKHIDTIECLKSIVNMQKTISWKIQESSNKIQGKDHDIA
jgi:hypothetical protein